MSLVNSKINPGVYLSSVIPQEILDDSENFVLFMKAYYEWMNTTSLSVNKISGNFAKNERIEGVSSGALATIKHVVSDNEIVVMIEPGKPFSDFERIVGKTSNAVASLREIKDNALRLSNKLLDYRNINESVDIFTAYLKDEIFYNLPTIFNGDKRLVGKKMRDFYASKGHEDSYKFLMKLLFNQSIDLYYPGKDIIIPSDGKYQKDVIMRTSVVASDGADDIFNFIFKTIKGFESEAVANVIEIKKFYSSGVEISEMKLKFVSGTFKENELIYDLNNPLGPVGLYTTVLGILSDYEIVEPGSGYKVGDFLSVNGDGTQAQIRVADIQSSGIDRLIVNTYGHGYQLGTYAQIDNANTGGTGLIVKVTGIANTYTVTDGSNNYTVGEVARIDVTNKGSDYYDTPIITLVDDTILNIGLITDKYISIVDPGENYQVGETLTFTPTTSGAGASAEIASVSNGLTDDYFVTLEDSSHLVNENNSDFIFYNRTNVIDQEWDGIGAIARIRMLDFGSGYALNDLPVITVNTVSGANADLVVTDLQGSGANVDVDTSNNTGGIGAIKSLEIVNFGIDYTQANTTIDATGVGNGDASINAIVAGNAFTTGIFTNDDGKLNYKIIQDSYYYQNYSYVIKSGIELKKYKDILKKLLHPAGLEVFGEISIVNLVSAEMESSFTINLDDISNIILSFIESLVIVEPTKLDDISDDLQVLANIQILEVSNQQLIEFENDTFASQYGAVNYEQYTKLIPLSGTANVYTANNTVIGTGTSFLQFFAKGSYVIIGENKFIVTGTTTNGTLTNTTMLINAPPENDIFGETVYRQSLLRR